MVEKKVKPKKRQKKSLDVGVSAKRRQREHRILILAIMFVGVVFSTVAVLGILNYDRDHNATEQQIALTAENATLRETDINSEVIEPEEDLDERNPYWSFIKMKLLDVNLNRLRAINPETKGWVQLSGTNVNYPFVQHADNEHYLKHTFDGSYNSAGWVFLDYRNKEDLSDRHSILYAHGRVDTTMFGDIRNLLASGWLSNRNNFSIRTSTQNENAMWQVFSIYHLPTTTDYLKISFSTDAEYDNFLKMITKRSAYNFNSAPTTSDRIITLSTCYSETERMVVHAKLIKYN